MSPIVLEIGGHTMSVYGADTARIVCTSPAFRPFHTDGAAQWEVHFGRELPSDDPLPELSRTGFPEGLGTLVFFGKEGTYRYEIVLPSGGAPLVVLHHVSGSRLVEVSPCGNPEVLRFALWLAYSLLSADVGATFVHSSVAVFRGRAVLFLGESGTGKSTHTRLWLKNIPGAHLLNDDSPVLSVRAGGGGAAVRPLVYGSPWSGKTDCYHSASFALAAIVRLSQAPSNSIRRLSVPEAFAALQPSLPPSLMQDERYADSLIDIVSDTIASVPVYHLGCLPDDAAALLSWRTVFGNEIQ